MPGGVYAENGIAVQQGIQGFVHAEMVVFIPAEPDMEVFHCRYARFKIRAFVEGFFVTGPSD